MEYVNCVPGRVHSENPGNIRLSRQIKYYKLHLLRSGVTEEPSPSRVKRILPSSWELHFECCLGLFEWFSSCSMMLWSWHSALCESWWKEFSSCVKAALEDAYWKPMTPFRPSFSSILFLGLLLLFSSSEPIPSSSSSFPPLLFWSFLPNCYRTSCWHKCLCRYFALLPSRWVAYIYLHKHALTPLLTFWQSKLLLKSLCKTFFVAWVALMQYILHFSKCSKAFANQIFM